MVCATADPFDSRNVSIFFDKDVQGERQAQPGGRHEEASDGEWISSSSELSWTGEGAKLLKWLCVSYLLGIGGCACITLKVEALSEHGPVAIVAHEA